MDFGGNQSGHSFVARGYTDNYADVIALKSKRIMAKDENEDIDSNRLNELFCEFIQEVIDEYAVCVRHGDYVEYCNVESVYWDNAETVLGNSIRNAVEKEFPWIMFVRQRKEQSTTESDVPSSLWERGDFLLQKIVRSLTDSFSDAVWNQEIIGKDERLDDGSTDIDSLDAFEYTIERDIKYLIEEVGDV